MAEEGEKPRRTMERKAKNTYIKTKENNMGQTEKEGEAKDRKVKEDKGKY